MADHPEDKKPLVTTLAEVEIALPIGAYISTYRPGYVSEAITDKELEAALAHDLYQRAMDTAVRFLAKRARSSAEVRAHLKNHGLPEQLITTVICRLEEQNVLNDRDLASSLINEKSRSRPQSADQLLAHLARRGVDPSVAEHAVADALEEGLSDVDEARKAAQKWRTKPNEAPAKARVRLIRHLMGRGFEEEIAVEIAAERFGDPDADYTD